MGLRTDRWPGAEFWARGEDPSITLEVLLDRLPDIDLAVPAETLVRRPSAFLRGMTSLPVRFTPVRAVGGTP